MKKKIILGLVALFSVLAYAQTETESDTPTRKFWGKSCGEEMPQKAMTSSITAEDTTSYCCYYVLWINTGCHWE